MTIRYVTELVPGRTYINMTIKVDRCARFTGGWFDTCSFDPGVRFGTFEPCDSGCFDPVEIDDTFRHCWFEGSEHGLWIEEKP